jgi:hypothetical protein
MSRRPGERVTALDAVALERVRAHGAALFVVEVALARRAPRRAP